MKRFLLISLLALGLAMPQSIPLDGGARQWVTLFTAQARHKKPQKTKATKQAAKGKHAKRVSTRADVMPLISASPGAAAVQSKDRSLLRVKVPGSVACKEIDYKAIKVYFDRRRRIPACVAYELNATMVAMADAPGAERRKNYRFSADSSVPGSPGAGDYSGSGYTRGHMAPAMDMRWDAQAMRECFYMTNMCPQVAKLNNDHWRRLEEAIHRWAKRDGHLIVLTGPIMGAKHGGIGPNHDIAIPEAFYKIVYAPQQHRAIAFIYANAERNAGMERNAVTISEVERRTGIDFFTSLSQATQREIESQCNFAAWK